jgi:hypothetical protein
MNGLTFLLAGIGVGLALVLWMMRVALLVEGLLRAASDVLEDPRPRPGRNFFYFQREELSGTYKGRDVTIGVVYLGIRGEFLVLPHIRLKLHESIGYNLNRLPHYATLEKSAIVYKMKASFMGGIFDKGYPLIFNRSFLVIALDKLRASAEDLESGRTYKDVFK